MVYSKLYVAWAAPRPDMQWNAQSEPFPPKWSFNAVHLRYVVLARIIVCRYSLANAYLRPIDRFVAPLNDNLDSTYGNEKYFQVDELSPLHSQDVFGVEVARYRWL